MYLYILNIRHFNYNIEELVVELTCLDGLLAYFLLAIYKLGWVGLLVCFACPLLVWMSSDQESK